MESHLAMVTAGTTSYTNALTAPTQATTSRMCTLTKRVMYFFASTLAGTGAARHSPRTQQKYSTAKGHTKGKA